MLHKNLPVHFPDIYRACGEKTTEAAPPSISPIKQYIPHELEKWLTRSKMEITKVYLECVNDVILFKPEATKSRFESLRTKCSGFIQELDVIYKRICENKKDVEIRKLLTEKNIKIRTFFKHVSSVQQEITKLLDCCIDSFSGPLMAFVTQSKKLPRRVRRTLRSNLTKWLSKKNIVLNEETLTELIKAFQEVSEKENYSNAMQMMCQIITENEQNKRAEDVG